MSKIKDVVVNCVMIIGLMTVIVYGVIMGY